MVLSDVKTDLFQFFAAHETFSMEENFDNLYILSENKELDKALIEKALEEYVTQGVVVKIEPMGKPPVWVLNKPINQYNQSLELTYPTLAGITNVVNQYCDSIKNTEAKVNPLDITEKDIQSLLLIISQLLGNGEHG